MQGIAIDLGKDSIGYPVISAHEIGVFGFTWPVLDKIVERITPLDFDFDYYPVCRIDAELSIESSLAIVSLCAA